MSIACEFLILSTKGLSQVIVVYNLLHSKIEYLFMLHGKSGTYNLNFQTCLIVVPILLLFLLRARPEEHEFCMVRDQFTGFVLQPMTNK